MDFIRLADVKPYIEFFFIDRKDLIINGLKSGSIHHYKSIVYEFFNVLDKIDNFTFSDAQRVAMEFALVVKNISFHLDISIEKELSLYYQNGIPNVSGDPVTWLKTFINDIFDTIYNKLYVNQQGKSRKQIYWIKAYIDTHFNEKISLTYLEQKCFLCKEYLLRLFKKEFDHTIYEYVLLKRMERAKELLCNYNTDISKISVLVGFNDSNYFSKAFKRHFGISPSEYRTSCIMEKNNHPL